MLFREARVEATAGRRGKLTAFPSEHLLFSVQGSGGRRHMAWYRKPERSTSDHYPTRRIGALTVEAGSRMMKMEYGHSHELDRS